MYENDPQKHLDWLEDNYEEWRKIYSPAVVNSRADLRADEKKIKEGIAEARKKVEQQKKHASVITNKKLVAAELIKIAKLLTASSNPMDKILPEEKLMALESKVDAETWQLAVEVYQKLKDDMELSSNQNEALNRLLQSCESNFKSDLNRNNIFKAAHALGIKLPSSFF